MKRLSFSLALSLALLTGSTYSMNEQYPNLPYRAQKTMTAVRSTQEFDAIIHRHENVIALLYNPVFIASDVAQLIAQDLLASVDVNIHLILVDTNLVPSIVKTCPFSTSASLVSFTNGVKTDQIDINLTPIAQ